MSKSTKNTSISQQIEELEQECERIKEYDKLLSKAVKIRTGVELSELEKMLKNNDKNQALKSQFASEIIKYFNLKNESDLSNFVSIMCCESSLKFYTARAENRRENVAETEQG